MMFRMFNIGLMQLLIHKSDLHTMITYTLLLTFCFISRLYAEHQSDNVTEEVCMLDRFSPNCDVGTVILITRAVYGRMQFGKCITRREDLNCSTDVLEHVKRKCSGRQTCEMALDSNLRNSPHGCDSDRMTYLEVSYRCISVYDVPVPTPGDCRNHQPLRVFPDVGYLASVVTKQTSRGSSLCPWEISTESGRTISLTLIDFGNENQTIAKEQVSESVCFIYAKVTEASLSSTPILVCGTEEKERFVYKSTTNSIHVTLVHVTNVHYLIKYEAAGCADFVVLENGKRDRSGNQIKVQCSEREDVWHATCVGRTWHPNRTCLVNELAQQPSIIHSSGANQGAIIMLVIGIALVISIAIVVVGILFLRCKSRRNRPDAALGSMDQSKYSGPIYIGGSKQLYPMLTGQDRVATDWERDYATTLQMRQNVFPTSGLISNPDVWTCPIHGSSGTTPSGTFDRRFRSLRPRLEHIYEIPRLDQESGMNLENGNISPFYHELDPNALSTLE